MTSPNGTRLAAGLLTALILAGALLPAPSSAIATTPSPPPPGWSPEGTIRFGVNERPTSMAEPANGSTAAVATEFFGASGTTVSARVRTSGFWAQRTIVPLADYSSAPVVLTTDDYARSFVVGVWAQVGNTTGLYVSMFSPATFAPVVTQVSDTPQPQVVYLAASPAGAVMALWVELNSSYQLFVNHSSPGGAWDGAVAPVPPIGYLRNLQLVATGDDDFLLVWSERNASQEETWAAPFTGSGGWGPAQEIMGRADSEASLVAAASPAAGRAVVFAWQTVGTTRNLTAATFEGGMWSAPDTVATVDDMSLEALTPEAAVDALGTVHLLWGERRSTATRRNLTYESLSWPTNWTASWHATADSLADQAIAASATGGVAITWSTSQAGVRSLMVARFVPGSGWRPTEQVDTQFSPSHSASPAFAALAATGNYTAVWTDSEGADLSLVYRDFIAGNDPPALAVASPLEGTVTGDGTVAVQGTAAPGARVVVDGTVAQVAADGSFGARVAVPRGPHEIEVYATDAWGNTAEASVNVTYADPVPGLEANLSAAQADALAAHELAHTVQQRADAADARAANLSDALNATNALYQHQQTDLEFLNESAANATAAAASAQSSAGTALAVGAIGLIVGAAGVSVALLRKPPRGGGGGGGGGGGSGEKPADGIKQVMQQQV